MESNSNPNSNSNQPNRPYTNKEIEDLIESDFEKIEENESKTYEFVPDQTKVVEKPNFVGELKKKVQFIVIRQNDPDRKLKKLELSTIHVKRFYDQLHLGVKTLQVTRVGKGRDTRYLVKPIAK
jgi:hypothetical protein